MESRLYRIICNPAMMLTWIFGLLLIYHNGWEWYKANIWLHFKIGFVILLTIYHLYNKKIILLLQAEKPVMSSFRFRLYNEVPTLFLLTIVLLAVYKNLLNFGYTFVTIAGLGLLLYLITKWYKSKREKSKIN
jgi:putative membrane protein